MIHSTKNSIPNGHCHPSLREENGEVFVYYNLEKWDKSRLFSLVDNCQNLKENAVLLSKIVHHLLLKNDYNEIENIEDFKNWYRDQIEMEKTRKLEAKDQALLSGSLGILDCLHEPKIENQELEFYVTDPSNVPYVVKMPLNGPKVTCCPLHIEENTEEEIEEKISLI